MLSKTNSAAAANRLFLRAHNGILTSSRGDFSRVDGVVKKVEYRDHIDKKNGKHYFNWHLLIDDTSAGEYYDIAFSNHCDCFGYILSSLLSQDGLSALTNSVTIDFLPYGGERTKAIVSRNGRDIPVGERMPELIKITADNATTYDGSARHAWLLSAMDRINRHISTDYGA